MTDKQPRPPAHRPAKWFRWAEASSVGIEMAVAVSLGTVGGMWLQNNVTHWAPWTSLIGFFIGLGAAVLSVVRTVKNFKRELAEQKADEADAKGKPGASDDARKSDGTSP